MTIPQRVSLVHISGQTISWYTFNNSSKFALLLNLLLSSFPVDSVSPIELSKTREGKDHVCCILAPNGSTCLAHFKRLPIRARCSLVCSFDACVLTQNKRLVFRTVTRKNNQLSRETPLIIITLPIRKMETQMGI